MQRVNFPYKSAYDEGYRNALMDADRSQEPLERKGEVK